MTPLTSFTAPSTNPCTYCSPARESAIMISSPVAPCTILATALAKLLGSWLHFTLKHCHICAGKRSTLSFSLRSLAVPNESQPTWSGCCFHLDTSNRRHSVTNFVLLTSQASMRAKKSKFTIPNSTPLKGVFAQSSKTAAPRASPAARQAIKRMSAESPLRHGVVYNRTTTFQSRHFEAVPSNTFGFPRPANIQGLHHVSTVDQPRPRVRRMACQVISRSPRQRVDGTRDALKRFCECDPLNGFGHTK